MGSVVHTANAAVFHFTIQGQSSLAFPVTGPFGEVTGFSLRNVELPDQEQVDRAAARFQDFYDGLPDDERNVFTTLLVQAVEMQESLWPAASPTGAT